ncbi:hypothetical protein IV203_000132 [Nitzschia inconspicua]|uniref:Uncharacterized protein n=1 Tax=Nitzschia inconspicua TaxID=303405 RepID=A0A9K3L605_9STRA|nr:hypothetical protein IV203_000132 [Nitzschia inconspicua]
MSFLGETNATAAHAEGSLNTFNNNNNNNNNHQQQFDQTSNRQLDAQNQDKEPFPTTTQPPVSIRSPLQALIAMVIPTSLQQLSIWTPLALLRHRSRPIDNNTSIKTAPDNAPTQNPSKHMHSWTNPMAGMDLIAAERPKSSIMKVRRLQDSIDSKYPEGSDCKKTRENFTALSEIPAVQRDNKTSLPLEDCSERQRQRTPDIFVALREKPRYQGPKKSIWQAWQRDDPHVDPRKHGCILLRDKGGIARILKKKAVVKVDTQRKPLSFVDQVGVKFIPRRLDKCNSNAYIKDIKESVKTNYSEVEEEVGRRREWKRICTRFALSGFDRHYSAITSQWQLRAVDAVAAAALMEASMANSSGPITTNEEFSSAESNENGDDTATINELVPSTSSDNALNCITHDDDTTANEDLPTTDSDENIDYAVSMNELVPSTSINGTFQDSIDEGITTREDATDTNEEFSIVESNENGDDTATINELVPSTSSDNALNCVTHDDDTTANEDFPTTDSDENIDYAVSMNELVPSTSINGTFQDSIDEGITTHEDATDTNEEFSIVESNENDNDTATINELVPSTSSDNALNCITHDDDTTANEDLPTTDSDENIDYAVSMNELVPSTSINGTFQDSIDEGITTREDATDTNEEFSIVESNENGDDTATINELVPSTSSDNALNCVTHDDDTTANEDFPTTDSDENIDYAVSMNELVPSTSINGTFQDSIDEGITTLEEATDTNEEFSIVESNENDDDIATINELVPSTSSDNALNCITHDDDTTANEDLPITDSDENIDYAVSMNELVPSTSINGTFQDSIDEGITTREDATDTNEEFSIVESNENDDDTATINELVPSTSSDSTFQDDDTTANEDFPIWTLFGSTSKHMHSWTNPMAGMDLIQSEQPKNAILKVRRLQDSIDSKYPGRCDCKKTRKTFTALSKIPAVQHDDKTSLPPKDCSERQRQRTPDIFIGLREKPRFLGPKKSIWQAWERDEPHIDINKHGCILLRDVEGIARILKWEAAMEDEIPYRKPLSFVDQVGVKFIPCRLDKCNANAYLKDLKESVKTNYSEVDEEVKRRREWKHVFTRFVMSGFDRHYSAITSQWQLRAAARQEASTTNGDGGSTTNRPHRRTTIKSTAMEVDEATVWVNGRRRSSRLQPKTGSIWMNGRRRSARFLS